MSSVTFEIQGLNPPGEGDEEDATGFAKTFPDIPCVSQMLGGPFLGLGLIHNTASEGKSEQEISWVLNFIFQHENDESVVNQSN